MSILPNKLLGVVGEHPDFPVERTQLRSHFVCALYHLYRAFARCTVSCVRVSGMSLSRDRQLIASCSHDDTIKFWGVAYVRGTGRCGVFVCAWLIK